MFLSYLLNAFPIFGNKKQNNRIVTKWHKKVIYLLHSLINVILVLDFLFSPRCQCPAQFEGPECQQNKHSFHGNGYAWFPPMMPCFESHVSLEFITDVADGLLLYSGPLAQLQAWDQEDFMAIGRTQFKLNKMSHLALIQQYSLFEDNCNEMEESANLPRSAGECPHNSKLVQGQILCVRTDREAEEREYVPSAVSSQS